MLNSDPPYLFVFLRSSSGTGTVWGSLSLVVAVTLVLTLDTAASRRNSKFARNWETLGRLEAKTNIKRHIVERTR